MKIWIVMVAAGLLTFGIRLSFIAAEGRFEMPPWFRAMLPFVPIATLTAIIVPELFLTDGAWNLSLGNERLVAGVVAIVVAAATRSVLLTLAIGFAVLLAVH